MSRGTLRPPLRAVSYTKSGTSCKDLLASMLRERKHLAIVRAGVAAAENQGTNVSFHVVGDATVYRLCDAPHPLDRMFYRIQALH